MPPSITSWSCATSSGSEAASFIFRHIHFRALDPFLDKDIFVEVLKVNSEVEAVQIQDSRTRWISVGAEVEQPDMGVSHRLGADS